MSDPMSPEQREQVFGLLREVHKGGAQAAFERLREQYPNPSWEDANTIIAGLRKEKKEAAGREIPEGNYALRSDDGTVTFYRVDRPSKGKWAGYVFISRLAGEVKYPVKGQQGAKVRRELERDPQAAAALYGTELGVCGICLRALTNEESRAYGIGPQCRSKFA